MNIPQAFGEDRTALIDTGASDYALGGPEAAAHDLPSVLHAGVRWSMVDVQVTPAEGIVGHAVVDVDLLVENTLLDSDARIPEGTVVLITNDGDRLGPGRFVDEEARLTIAPGDALELTISFSTGFDRDPSPGDLALTIGEPARVPSILPLAGQPSDEDESLFVAVDNTATLLADPDDGERQIVITAEAAAFVINAGPYRAANGERLALVKVVIERAVSNDTAAFLDTSYWALDTDQGSVPTILVARTSQPASNADEVTLLFAFPEGSEEFSLRAGANTNDDATFNVVVPNR